MERRFVRQLAQIGMLLVALYMIHLLGTVTGGWLLQFGIVPRSVEGLRGIFFSPLLHGSWSHLIANTAPLAVMLCLLAVSRRHSLWGITAAIWVMTGVAVWLVGRPDSLQIGASGVIFGLATFLIATAWLTRHLGSALIAVAVIFLYGSIVWGLLPGRRGVSWEGHLCGALSGGVVAKLTAKGRRKAA